jgi:hypothetical protein
MMILPIVCPLSESARALATCGSENVLASWKCKIPASIDVALLIPEVPLVKATLFSSVYIAVSCAEVSNHH